VRSHRPVLLRELPGGAPVDTVRAGIAAHEDGRVARLGRPARLSRDAVISAAEAVVRGEGSAALSMRRVARELDSSPMALYRHVRDKDDLLRHLLDRIAHDLQRPAPPHEPHDRVMVVGRAVHDWLIAHRWAIDVLPAHLMGWSTAWIVDDIVAALIAGGMSPHSAARGYQVIWQYMVGELTLAHAGTAGAGGQRAGPDAGDLRQRGLDTLASLAQAWPDSSDDAFDLGLAALVDGLLAMTATQR
jgi:AcrR family transcriptional regulator